MSKPRCTVKQFTESLWSDSYLVGVKRHAGFTLLELLATVAVAGIIVIVGVPSFLGIVQSNRVATQTNELVAALSLARTEAVKRGRNVRVDVAQEGTGWTANVIVVGAGDPLRTIVRSSSAVTVDDDASVVFGPTGVPVPMAMTTINLQPLTSCSGMLRRRIAIAVSGQITTTRETCG